MNKKVVIIGSVFFMLGLLCGVSGLNKAVAAAAKCFAGEGSDFKALSECPGGTGGNTVYRLIDGTTGSAPVNDKCYFKMFFGDTPFYQEYSCSEMDSRLREAKIRTCTDSGGEWSASSPSDQGRCACPAAGPNASGRCVDAQQNCADNGGQWQDSTGGERCVCSDGTTNTNGDCEDDGGGTGDAGPPDLNLDPEGSKILGYLQTAIDLLTAGAGLIITAMVIVSGIRYSASGGNPQAAAAAKKHISEALIALLCLAFLYGFLQWVVPGGVFNN